MVTTFVHHLFGSQTASCVLCNDCCENPKDHFEVIDEALTSDSHHRAVFSFTEVFLLTISQLYNHKSFCLAIEGRRHDIP